MPTWLEAWLENQEAVVLGVPVVFTLIGYGVTRLAELAAGMPSGARRFKIWLESTADGGSCSSESPKPIEDICPISRNDERVIDAYRLAGNSLASLGPLGSRLTLVALALDFNALLQPTNTRASQWDGLVFGVHILLLLGGISMQVINQHICPKRKALRAFVGGVAILLGTYTVMTALL